MTLKKKSKQFSKSTDARRGQLFTLIKQQREYNLLDQQTIQKG